MAVVDIEQRRIAVFDGFGKHVATRGFPLESPQSYLAPVAMTSSSQFVAKSLGLERPNAIGERISRPEAVVLGRFGVALVDTLVVTRGTELVGGVWREGGEESVAAYDLPFGRSIRVAVGPDRIYVGDTSKSELLVFDHAGRALVTIAWPSSRVAVTDDDRRAWVAQESTDLSTGTNASPVQIGEAMRDLRKLGFAQTRPVFTNLLVGEDNSVWIELDGRPWIPTRPFLVVRQDGSPWATIAVPRAFVPSQADSTSIVGVWREPGAPDEVRRYTVVR